LKLGSVISPDPHIVVASRAEAWVETRGGSVRDYSGACRLPRGGVG